MIASPCKTCSRRDQPKENCIKDCELLQALQNIQQTSKEDTLVPGIDYAEAGRFTFSLLSTKGFSVFN
jgi:hypothetical protein